MIRSLVPVLFTVFLAFPSFAQESANLGFEKIDRQTRAPQGWSSGIGKGSSGIQSDIKPRADSSIKREGRYSLSMEWSGGGSFASVVHVIDKKADAASIKLSGYLKTESVEGRAGLWMRIDGRTQTLAFDNMQSRPVSGTTGWTQYEITLPYDREAAERIHVGALLVGSGKIWIDDFRITLDGKDLSEVAPYSRLLLPAERDTSNYAGSGIASIPVNAELVNRLTNLGMVWGFMKYYHSGVQEGNHNMDARLFKFLPMMLAAKDSVQAMEFLERWVEMFGTPTACPECRDIDSATDVAQKPDFSALFQKGRLSPSLLADLEHIRRNRSRGGPQHFYVSLYPGVENPQFKNEYAYPNEAYPDAGVRLLSLVRYWNYIQYFFPYRHLIGEDWNKVLPDMIPEFCNARNAAEYQSACLRMIARIHDTHANIWSNAEALDSVKGAFITPFRARFIEGKLVVTGYYYDALTSKPNSIDTPLRVGDVIERIDGVPVEVLVKKHLPLSPASNYETQLRVMSTINGFLLRSNKKDLDVEVLRDGKSSSIKMQRLPVASIAMTRKLELFQPKKGFAILPGNIGYLYPAMLGESSLDSVKSSLGKTAGLIIDLRCYPGTFMPFTYGEWLKPRATTFVSFTTGSTDLPGLFVKSKSISNGRSNSDYYLGKVVIIVNEITQSQAEYTTMALQTVPGALTIGSTTAGADGNVSQITLPGGLSTMISGIGVLYPDGTETQRKGVKIDRVIKPTIKGVRVGRDELLEEAVRIIQGK